MTKCSKIFIFSTVDNTRRGVLTHQRVDGSSHVSSDSAATPLSSLKRCNVASNHAGDPAWSGIALLSSGCE